MEIDIYLFLNFGFENVLNTYRRLVKKSYYTIEMFTSYESNEYIYLQGILFCSVKTGLKMYEICKQSYIYIMLYVQIVPSGAID